MLTICGCSRSDKASQEGAPSNVSLLSATQSGRGGSIPPTIVHRQWNADDNAPSAIGELPNQLDVRVYAEQEVVAVSRTREPFLAKPGSRTVCLLAFTCIKPECVSQGSRGRPLLFTNPPEEFIIGERGQVMRPSFENIVESIDLVWGRPLCPVCGSNHRVREYVLPEVRQRLHELEAELAAARSARKANRDMPDDVRTPAEILAEINALPQLFLKREIP
jgi:hypothetical protein